ncbi:Replication-associated protein RepC [Fructilactobacillus cliffordii]|uniref:Replication-associated protein RepC n=1 Tax=Fructilactobacillus cliffordii TaxID=2940299 RepID=A0A9Q9E3J0_9LACO|nr:Replication-associated protein RepC [Fructilactobacillus cliffordii]USS89989.1 Replication-associated protein RepC [Fructilactobacillus cliffordii]
MNDSDRKVKFTPKRKKVPKEVGETPISTPGQTYNPNTVTSESVSSSPKPKKKQYSTIRLQKQRVHQVNALQNALAFDTQDQFLAYILKEQIEGLSDREKTMYNMYMDTYEARDRRK